VVAHVSEDQLAALVNVAAVAAMDAAPAVVAVSAAVVVNMAVVATNTAAVVGAESEDRSRGPIQGTAKASFFMKCVPQKQKGCDRTKIAAFSVLTSGP
jgi:hypothetical protein